MVLHTDLDLKRCYDIPRVQRRQEALWAAGERRSAGARGESTSPRRGYVGT